jgi:hypothetical protein
VSETPQPLTDAERAELDSYGVITGRMLLPPRAIELWTREMMWGPVPALAGGLGDLIDMGEGNK